jgi:hypothetical protein
LKALRSLADSHVQRAVELIGSEQNLLAASTPDDFINPSWIDEFGLLADDLWLFGLDTVDDLFRVRWGVPIPPTTRILGVARSAIEDARESYLDLLRFLISDRAYSLTKEPVFGEFRVGDQVQYGDVRGLLVKLGGGSVDPEVSLQGGVTTGRYMKEYLAEAGIASDQKIWLYGFEEQPRRTFNGHLQMNGLVFEQWDDDGLIIAPQDIWLRRNYYAPGDHWGCACVVAPYFPNFGEPFLI